MKNPHEKESLPKPNSATDIQNPGTTAAPGAPIKYIAREDTGLINAFTELLTGPPKVKRSLFRANNTAPPILTSEDPMNIADDHDDPSSSDNGLY